MPPHGTTLCCRWSRRSVYVPRNLLIVVSSIVYFGFGINVWHCLLLFLVCLFLCLYLTGGSAVWLQLAVRGLAQSCERTGPTGREARDGSPAMRERTALALTCISADGERSIRVCVRLLPTALNSPLTPFRSWFVWVTSANLRRHSGWTSRKAVSFTTAYFHLISHQYEMGAYEKAHFTVHWVAVLKRIH